MHSWWVDWTRHWQKLRNPVFISFSNKAKPTLVWRGLVQFNISNKCAWNPEPIKKVVYTYTPVYWPDPLFFFVFFLTLNGSGFETRKMRGEGERGGREGMETLQRCSSHLFFGSSWRSSWHVSNSERRRGGVADVRGQPKVTPNGPCHQPSPWPERREGQTKVYHLLTACNMKPKFSIEDRH